MAMSLVDVAADAVRQWRAGKMSFAAVQNALLCLAEEDFGTLAFVLRTSERTLRGLVRQLPLPVGPSSGKKA